MMIQLLYLLCCYANGFVAKFIKYLPLKIKKIVSVYIYIYIYEDGCEEYEGRQYQSYFFNEAETAT